MATTALSAKPGRVTQREPPLRAQAALSAGSTRAPAKHRSSNVFWIKLNFTVKAARLQSLKRHKYQHLQEEALLRARGLLKNWEDGPVLLIEDLYRQATAAAASGSNGTEATSEDANELLNYTPEALALRFSLRNDPAVLSAVKELWAIDTGPRDALGCIDQKAYTSLFRRIAKCVDAEAFPQATTAHHHNRQHHHKRVEQTIHEDWKRDSKGEREMSFASFFDSVFELADLWCETIQVDEYIDFLKRIRDRISERKKVLKRSSGVTEPKRVLRPMKKVRALDEDDSEESESESEELSESEEEVSETSAEPVETSKTSGAGGEDDGFPHSSMVHRFLTVKSLGAKSPSVASQTHKMKLSSAASSQALQPLQRHKVDAAGRFVAIAHQQQLVQRQSLSAQQQRSARRPSGVTTLRFGDDGTGRIALVTNSSVSNSEAGSDLTPLMAGGTAFQPAAVASVGSSSRGNSLAQMKPINETDMVRKATSIDFVDETRPRTPTVAVHMVESDLDGIISSALGATSEDAGHVSSANSRTPGFASATRHAILSLARSPNHSPLQGSSGFRDVVFHAMHGKTESSHAGLVLASGTADSGSSFGSIIGAKFHAPAAATSNDRSGSETSASEPSRAHLVTVPSQASSPVFTSNPPAVAGPPPQQVSSLSRNIHTSRSSTSAASSMGPLTFSRPVVASTQVKTRTRQSEAAVQHQQKKRALLPMSTLATQPQLRTSPYHLARDGDESASNNFKQTNLVDLSASYQTTSYAAETNFRATATTMRASGSSSLSALDPYATITSTVTPLWFGLKPKREPRNGLVKRARTPPSTITTATGGQRTETRRFSKQPRQLQQDDLSARELASPWDTYEDDNSFDSDFLLGRDWQAFSLVDTAASVTPAHEPRLALGSASSPPRSPHDRQQQKTNKPQQQIFASVPEPQPAGPSAKGYTAGPSLIVTALGSSPMKLSHSISMYETDLVSTSATNGGLHEGQLHASQPQLLVFTPAVASEQLHISKSSLHQHDQPPDAIGRPLSPTRSQGCSRCEKRQGGDCDVDHSLESERPKSPVFKLEKRRATLGVPCENSVDRLRANRELLDDVTILLNARRELTLQPKNEGDSGLARLHAPTRSEMMKRRYKYTFGRT